VRKKAAEIIDNTFAENLTRADSSERSGVATCLGNPSTNLS